MSADIWGLLAFLSMLWGGSFLFIAIAVKELPPFTIVLSRVLLAALVLVLLLRLKGGSLPLTRSFALTVGVMALFNNVLPFSLIVWAQGHIPSGLASILNATTPLFTVTLLHFATDEKVTPLKVAGLAAGFLGVVVMLGRDLKAVDVGALLPPLAVLVATMSYAVSGLWGRRFGALGIAPLPAAGGQMVASSLMLAPLVLLVDRPWQLGMPSLPVVLSIIALALFSTALAYLIFFRILVRAGAANLLLVTFLIPVSAILLGTLVLGERLALPHFAGMGLIALGLALIDGRLFRRRAGVVAP